VEEMAPGTASNVTNLIMGLSPVPAVHNAAPTGTGHQSHVIHSPYTRTPLTPQRSPADEAVVWTRGRQPQSFNPNTWGTSSGGVHGHNTGYGSGVSVERRGPRPVSPPSTRGMGPDFGSSPSLMSSSPANKSNWRSSMSTTSSASTSTSAFTRYSNSSTRSISTMATSVSSGSWRAQTKTSGQSGMSKNNGEQQAIPKNVKIMDGVPWALDQLPRQQYMNPVGDIFGQPPQRKARTRKPKDPKLDTINERPGAPQKHAVHQRRDAATSTTDLDGVSEAGADGVPRKVQKGQITALAKMLSALRR